MTHVTIVILNHVPSACRYCHQWAQVAIRRISGVQHSFAAHREQIMPKCSVRSCNETAIAGFIEEIEIGSVTFPLRTIPGTTRYWCRRHSCLALETQGKLGHAFDLSSEAAPDDQNDPESEAPPLYVAELDAPDPKRKPIAEKSPAANDRRKRDRFRVDGMAEANVPNSQILFRGLTSDLSYDGCYIQSPAYLSADLGDEVEVRFTVSDVHFRATAKVTAIRRGKGAGFEFLHVEEEAQNNLNTLIEKLSSPTSVSAGLSADCGSPEFTVKPSTSPEFAAKDQS